MQIITTFYKKNNKTFSKSSLGSFKYSELYEEQLLLACKIITKKIILSLLNLFIGNSVTSDGAVIYSAVRAFLKKQPTVSAVYKSIVSDQNNIISLSENHLIYTRKSYTSKFNLM